MRVFILIAALCFFMQSAVCAQETKKEVVSKTITGVVSGVSYNFIAVGIGQSEKGDVSLEMAFNVDKSVKIEHKSSIKDIKAGDTVSVDYTEVTETAPDGTKKSQRTAKAITFLRPGASVQAGAGTETLESARPSNSMPLSIKGIKKGD